MSKNSVIVSNTRWGWRPVDFVTASILGVVCGFIFLIWNGIGGVGWNLFEAITPGVGGLVTGIWFIGGPLGGLIIRKPGAAIYVETLASITSMILGSQWGISTIYSGLTQGLGAEVIFLLFLYRRFSLPVSIAAGAGSGIAAWIFEGFYSGNFAKEPVFLVIYLSCLAVSGAVLAGLTSHYLTAGLAKTGVLNRFGAGRNQQAAV